MFKAIENYLLSYDFLSYGIVWFPKIILWVILLLALYLFIRRDKINGYVKKLSLLAYCIIGLRVGYSAVLTILQYMVWSKYEFTRTLINAPVDASVPIPFYLSQFNSLWHSKLGYFSLYSFGRFWQGMIITLIVAGIFTLIVAVIKKYRPEAVVASDIPLALLCSLAVAWPRLVIFIPMVFVIAIPLWLLSNRLFGDERVRLSGPMLYASIIVVIWGDILVKLLGLGVLKI